MLALDERNKWREELRKGNIPPEVQQTLDWYKSLRDKGDFRSSKIVERLGEIALVWEEQLNNKNQR